jgi:hypothetical protein
MGDVLTHKLNLVKPNNFPRKDFQDFQGKVIPVSDGNSLKEIPESFHRMRRNRSRRISVVSGRLESPDFLSCDFTTA